MSRKTGTVFWLNVILDHDELDPADTLLLIALADHVDEHDVAWPSLRTLARRGRVGYSTAKRRMKSLEQRGYVTRSARRRADGGRGTDSYRLQRSRFGMSGCASSPAEDTAPTAHIEPGVSSDRTGPTAHPGEPAEVPKEEPEEEETQQQPSRFDELVDPIAERLLELRDAEMPDPVRQRKPWLAKARRRLRADEQMPRAAEQVTHPSIGCRGDGDRQIDALAELHRTGDWPTPPPPRRHVAIDLDLELDPSTSVDTATPRTAMTDAARAARAALTPGGTRT